MNPVPVLFSLAGWNPDTQPRVQEFLATQITIIYPALRAIHPDAAAALVDQGRILPILDGLDEVPRDRRAAIMTALNITLDGGVILTTRRPEYRTTLDDIGQRLTGAAVIIPYALTPADVAGYLRKHLPPDPGTGWEQLLRQIRIGTATTLSAVTATPLGLWLLRAVYLDTARDPAALLETYRTPAALQAHLLEQLVSAVVRARPPLPRRRRESAEAPLRPARRHSPDHLQNWLTTLAQQLRSDRDWAWWEVTEETFRTRRSRLAARAAIGLAFGLVAGLAYGIWPQDVPTGLVPGLAVCFLTALMVKPGGGLQPKAANFRLSGRVNELFRSLAFWAGRGIGRWNLARHIL